MIIKNESVKIALKENTKEEHEAKELKTFRILLLVTFFAYPIIGVINTYLQKSEDFNILIQRFTFSLLIGVFLLLSYKIDKIQTNFYLVITSCTYIGISHLTYIAAINGYSFSHLLGIIIVLVGTSLVYKKLNHLKYYLLYTSILNVLTSIISPENQIDKLTALFFIFTACLIIYFALQLQKKSQKKLMGSEANINALIENAEGIIWSIDNQFNYIAFNKSFQYFVYAITNKIPEIGKSVMAIQVYSELSNVFKENYAKVFKGETLRFEQLIKINNEERIYSFSLSPIKVEFTKVIGVTVFGNDITNEKNYEAELIKAKNLAENLASTKEHFLASMSHEIRTPLNGILGFTKLLLQGKNLTPDQLKQLNAVKSSGDILLVIINDILDLSKIEAGKMHLESSEIDIVSITKQAIDTFEVKIDEKNIEIEFSNNQSIPKLLLGDSVRISQILLNIISNAVKFTPEKGKIKIDINCEAVSEDATRLIFKIKDTGIGIPKDKINIIFDPFVQTSDDTARKYGGTGLGLSIVKKIINLMKGTIKVESEFEKGTQFTIEFQLKNSKINSEVVAPEISTVSKTINYSEIKILLAEDNLINQLLAQTVLGQFGFQITTVENGLKAVEEIKQNEYDLVLMDLMMPVMDGYIATQEIRNLESKMKKEIPIIALTADVTITDVEKCKSVGMNDYLSKPFTPDELLKKITILLNKTKNN